MIPRRSHCGERELGCICEGERVVTCGCDCGACGKAFEAEAKAATYDPSEYYARHKGQDTGD